jgi:hypothetical protein
MGKVLASIMTLDSCMLHNVNAGLGWQSQLCRDGLHVDFGVRTHGGVLVVDSFPRSYHGK